MTIYLAIFGCVFCISCVMESLRRKITCKSRTYLLWIIGLSLSAVFATIIFFAFRIISNNASYWSIVYYTLVIYYLQKDMTLEVLKPLLKKVANRI